MAVLLESVRPNYMEHSPVDVGDDIGAADVVVDADEEAALVGEQVHHQLVVVVAGLNW